MVTIITNSHFLLELATNASLHRLLNWRICRFRALAEMTDSVIFLGRKSQNTRCKQNTLLNLLAPDSSTLIRECELVWIKKKQWCQYFRLYKLREFQWQ